MPYRRNEGEPRESENEEYRNISTQIVLNTNGKIGQKMNRQLPFPREIQILCYFVRIKAGDSVIVEYPSTQISKGKIKEIAENLFQKAHENCDINISFVSDGPTQENSFRQLALDHIRAQSIESGRQFAEKLYAASSARSGPSLLFVVTGKVMEKIRITFARFPASEGMAADFTKGNLDISYIDNLFVEDDQAFKAAMFEFDQIPDSNWTGKATDKQINHQTYELSKYWVHKFLECHYVTTSKLGSKRLFEALKKVSNSGVEDSVRDEVFSLITLLKNLNGKPLSINSVLDQFAVSAITKSEIAKAIENPQFLDEQFELDYSLKGKSFNHKTIRIDSGVRLSAPVDKFSELITREDLDGSTIFTTKGRVVSIKLNVDRNEQ